VSRSRQGRPGAGPGGVHGALRRHLSAKTAAAPAREGKGNCHPGQDPATPATTHRFREDIDHGGLGRRRRPGPATGSRPRRTARAVPDPAPDSEPRASISVQGGHSMTSTLTATSPVAGADGATRARPADARLAPGGQERGGEHDAGVAHQAPTGEAARWQRILDLLDPGKRCGAWCPATFAGRPVVCTRAPHDAREQHSDAETGWRWYDEKALKTIPTDHQALRTTQVSHPISVSAEPVHARRLPRPDQPVTLQAAAGQNRAICARSPAGQSL